MSWGGSSRGELRRLARRSTEHGPLMNLVNAVDYPTVVLYAAMDVEKGWSRGA
jgi:hypothetical protein